MKSEQAKRPFLYVSFFYLLIFAVWQMLFSAGLIPDYLFPSPVQVGKRLWELGSDDYLLPSVKATLVRMAMGFSIAADMRYPIHSLSLVACHWSLSSPADGDHLPVGLIIVSKIVLLRFAIDHVDKKLAQLVIARASAKRFHNVELEITSETWA